MTPNSHNNVEAEPGAAPASRQSPNLVALSIALAQRAHSNQFRRDRVTPYITHPQAVAKRVAGDLDEVIATAWLHDVLEDTCETAESLRRAGICEIVIEAVTVLTKRGDGYAEYLAQVKSNSIACRVKVADMLHNLRDNPTDHQIIKYARGLLILLGEPK